MTELERKIKAKIPGPDTGIEVRHTICDICSPGMHCGINAYIKDGKVIKIEGIDGHPSNDGRLCTKGLSNRQYIYREDRVLTPLKRVGKRGEGKFEPITWDEAYAEIAKGLNAAKESTARRAWRSTPATPSGTARCSAAWPTLSAAPTTAVSPAPATPLPLWPGKWQLVSRGGRIWPTATCSWAGHSIRSTPLT